MRRDQACPDSGRVQIRGGLCPDLGRARSFEVKWLAKENAVRYHGQVPLDASDR